MVAFDQAQTSIRSALNNFLPKQIQASTQKNWYQNPVVGSKPSGSVAQGFNSRVLGAQKGFLAENSYDNLMYKKQAEAMAAALQNPGTGQGTGGLGSPSDGNWAGVNKWDSYVQRAAAETGVPGNVIKSVMMIESQGVLDAMSPMTSSGNYYGLMQIGATSSVPEYMKSQSWMRGNAYNQILAGATELKNKYAAINASNWTQAAGAYFGYGTDVTGTTTEGYMGAFNNYMSQLSSATQSGGSAGMSGGGGRGIQGLFGSAAQSQNDFGVSSGNGLYEYGTAYGLNGTQHTGVDVMQPLGSPLYAPAGGTVVCVGCWRNDHLTGGVGRIEIEMPNGARVLFDHTNQSYVQVGQRLNGGELIGTSGGMYSPHTHMEVRIPDTRYSSGYRLVDPVAYFGGYVGTPGSGGGTAQPPGRQLNTPGLGWSALRDILGNR